MPPSVQKLTKVFERTFAFKKNFQNTPYGEQKCRTCSSEKIKGK